MDIGFIGLGNMGHPMARRLIEAGHRLIVYDRDRAAMERLVALGALPATSPTLVGDMADTVMASLPTPDIVLEVATGASGVIDGKRVRRFIDLSTTGPRMAQRIHELLARRFIAQIDAPVSGGVGGAEKGTLAVMASGPRAEIWLVEPLLSVIGKVFVVGERPGDGQTMKLLNNLLSATAMAATAEAMVMGVKAGLDPSVMCEVINSGSGRNTATMDKFPRTILPRSFDYGFSVGLMHKDVKLCLEEAKALGLDLDVGSAVGRVWQLVNDEVGPEKDFTRIVEPLERRAGVEVRAKPKEA